MHTNQQKLLVCDRLVRKFFAAFTSQHLTGEELPAEDRKEMRLASSSHSSRFMPTRERTVYRLNICREQIVANVVRVQKYASAPFDRRWLVTRAYFYPMGEKHQSKHPPRRWRKAGSRGGRATHFIEDLGRLSSAFCRASANEPACSAISRGQSVCPLRQSTGQ